MPGCRENPKPAPKICRVSKCKSAATHGEYCGSHYEMRMEMLREERMLEKFEEGAGP